MKKKLMKAVVLTLSAVVLVVATVFATVAYLAESAGVTNTFTVGDVSITMFEHQVDADGQIPSSNPVIVNGNTYHLIPNKTYDKNPTIEILKSENAPDGVEYLDNMYLFVKTVNQIRTAEAGNNGDTTHPTMRQQMEAYGWVEFIRSGNGTEIIWVYGTRNDEGVITPIPVNRATIQKNDEGEYVPGAVAGQFKLFDEFTIHKDVDVSRYKTMIIDITAFAIQTSGFNNAADGNALVKQVWDAVKETFPAPCSIVNPVNPYDKTMTGDDAYKPVPGAAVQPVGD